VIGALGAGCAGTRSPRQSAAPGAAIALPTGTVRDFDFLVGSWRGANRRLKQRWVGSDDWEEFPGALRCESRMGGTVNVSEVEFPTKGWSGVTIRSFDLEHRRWSSYWISSRTGVLLPPNLGGFTGDRGEFYSDDTDDGVPVAVRIYWTRLGPDTARWEQAFSRDGVHWELNWTADQTRIAGP
jgi:hypothetical protein